MTHKLPARARRWLPETGTGTGVFSAAGGAALAGALHKRRDCNTPDPRGRLLTKRTAPGPCGRPGRREARGRPAYHARVFPAGSLVTPGGPPRRPGVTSGATAAGGHQGRDRCDTHLPMRAGYRRSRPAGRSLEPVRPPRARSLVGQAHPGDPGQLTDIPLPASVSRRRPPPHPEAGAFATPPRPAVPGPALGDAENGRDLMLAGADSERWGASATTAGQGRADRARNRPLPGWPSHSRSPRAVSLAPVWLRGPGGGGAAC
jgi:LPXTG-motif cell wall-anchored protein